MSGKEQFVKLPREVLEGEAWRSLGINGLRVIHFLMIEHMRRGARRNRLLKAPHRQLVDFGIPKDCVTAAITEAEASLLVRAHRHGLRIATDYTLTWLPLHDGSPAGNEWRQYQAAAKRPARKRRNLPPKVGAGLPPKVGADSENLPPEVGAEPSENLPPEVGALYRSSYQGGGISKEVEGYGTKSSPAGVFLGDAGQAGAGLPPGKGGAGEGDGQPVDPTRTCRRYVVNGAGYRVCGRPTVLGADRCAEHALPVVSAP